MSCLSKMPCDNDPKRRKMATSNTYYTHQSRDAKDQWILQAKGRTFTASRMLTHSESQGFEMQKPARAERMMI